MMGAINALDIMSYLLLGGAAWCLLQIVNAITNAQGSQLNAVHALA